MKQLHTQFIVDESACLREELDTLIEVKDEKYFRRKLQDFYLLWSILHGLNQEQEKYFIDKRRIVSWWCLTMRNVLAGNRYRLNRNVWYISNHSTNSSPIEHSKCVVQSARLNQPSQYQLKTHLNKMKIPI